MPSNSMEKSTFQSPNGNVKIWYHIQSSEGFSGGTRGKEPFCQCRRHKRQCVWSMGQEDPLEEGMVPQSSILLGESPWTQKPGGLLSIELPRVGYNWSSLACTHDQVNLKLIHCLKKKKVYKQNKTNHRPKCETSNICLLQENTEQIHCDLG